MEEKEIAGVKVIMPRSQMLLLTKNYEEILVQWKPEEKISLLEGTMFKRKTLYLNKNSKRIKKGKIKPIKPLKE